jgi:aminomethyltransferase
MFNNPNLKKRYVPIQLRQTGDGKGKSGEGGLEGPGSRMLIDCRTRKGPYWHLSQEAGSWCYTIYNKIYHPRAYIPKEEGGVSAEYKYLTEHVTMWNVAVERQIMVKGPDASRLVDYVCTRKASAICPVGKCKYIIMCGPTGGILNDPILLRVAEDEWWFSLADSDINMYLQGINHNGAFNCEIAEIDVAPVQIQGPKAPQLMDDCIPEGSTCGIKMSQMKYYDCLPVKINGCDAMVTASGFSTELGYEIYLRDATINAEKMWNYVLEKGKKHHLKVIAPGHHRRIEAGLMSHGQDIDIEINPYECGMGWQVDLKRSDNFVGRKALEKVKAEGVTHKLAGLRMGGKPIEWYNADFYHVFAPDNKTLIGYVTSAWYSPTQGCNIAMAMLPVQYTKLGTQLGVALPNRYKDSDVDAAEVVKTPFKQPPKGNEGRGLNVTGSKL